MPSRNVKVNSDTKLETSLKNVRAGSESSPLASAPTHESLNNHCCTKIFKSNPSLSKTESRLETAKVYTTDEIVRNEPSPDGKATVQINDPRKEKPRQKAFLYGLKTTTESFCSLLRIFFSRYPGGAACATQSNDHFHKIRWHGRRQMDCLP